MLNPFGEIGVFRQEAIAGMNRHRIGHFGGADDRRHIQIAVGGRRRPDADRFIRQADVLEVPIYRGMYGDGADAEFPAGPQNPQGDFPPVGDHHFVQHSGVIQ